MGMTIDLRHGNVPLRFTAGNYVSGTVNYVDADGAALDVSSWNGWTIEILDRPDGATIVTAAVDATNGSTGSITWTFTADQTAALAGDYVWRLEQRVSASAAQDIAGGACTVALPGARGRAATSNEITVAIEDAAPVEVTVIGPDVVAIDDAAQAAAQLLLRKMHRDQGDASIVVFGDSTGNESDEWVYLTAVALGTAHPTYGVDYRLWDNGTAAWGTAVEVQAGTGGNTLTVWNASVAGWDAYDAMNRLDETFDEVQPDLVFVSIGHNESSATTTLTPVTGSDYENRILVLTEAIRAAAQASPIVLVAQNSATTNTNQYQRADALERIATARSHGLINVLQAFDDYGDWQSDLMFDSVHPNEAGSGLWRDTVMASMVYNAGLMPLPLLESTLTGGTEQLAVNGVFADFASSVPDGWSASSVTASKDQTNFETGAWACRLVPSASAGAYLYQDLPLSLVRGQWVTVSVRLRRNTAAQASTVGRIGLAETGGGAKSLTSRSEAAIDQAFYWVSLTNFIESTATRCRILLYANTAATGVGDITVDRVVACRGRLPRDLPGVP